MVDSTAKANHVKSKSKIQLAYYEGNIPHMLLLCKDSNVPEKTYRNVVIEQSSERISLLYLDTTLCRLARALPTPFSFATKDVGSAILLFFQPLFT